MSAKTKIEWTASADGTPGSTWNPVRGCTRVSEGCRNCYAERMAARRLPGLMSPTTGEPLAMMTPSGPRWTGRVELIESQVTIPLHWRKPRRIFVNSMSDTWHEKLHLRDIARIYAVAAYCHWHTFVILTKRPENRLAAIKSGRFQELVEKVWEDLLSRRTERPEEEADLQWPLLNVWEGVSVEDRSSVQRIDALRETLAALRFLSLEPLLEDLGELDLRGIGHVIAGGESGPGARPCRAEWIRSIVEQCKMAGTACFVKQLGAYAILDPRYDRSISGWTRRLRDRKGGNPEEWPEDLRVCQIPEVRP